MPQINQEELQQLRDNFELIKADAKRARRAASLTVQLAARSLEQLDNVQSKEDTTNGSIEDRVEES